MEGILSKRYMYANLVERINNKERCALATVVETYGSSPQKPGSSAIFNKRNLLEGTIGGGKVEYEIQNKAKIAIDTKKSGFYRYELDDEITADNSVICGGGMNVLLDATPENQLGVFTSLVESCRKRIPGVLLTVVDKIQTGEVVIERIFVHQKNIDACCKGFPSEVKQELKNVLLQAKKGVFTGISSLSVPEEKDKKFFLEAIVPLPRLIIAGAGHVGKALTSYAKLLDFETTVWDDRPEYANKNNLPDADTILSGALETSLGKLDIQPDTFIVIVTRGHKNDSDVLKKFIGSKAAYIGMIGSRSKIALVKKQFLEKGWATIEQWNKIHAPIGLKIHSKTVQEIAISIAAQLVQVRYKKLNVNE